jgi:hypothetical protein
MKYMKEFIAQFSSKPGFSSYEARNFFTFRHGPEGYYKLVPNNLVKSGRIYRITRGNISSMMRSSTWDLLSSHFITDCRMRCLSEIYGSRRRIQS